MGPPPEGALNLAAWQMIRELVSSDPSINQAAWNALRRIAGILTPDHGDGKIQRAVGGYL
ncbi:MAG: hypothetical protein JO356_05355 [Acidobacteria bacterium]|nr:hypothetical protein [Acidobacteriota bacterium]